MINDSNTKFSILLWNDLLNDLNGTTNMMLSKKETKKKKKKEKRLNETQQSL
jgi:hypothetical protein